MNVVEKREEPNKNKVLNEQNYVEIAEEVIEKLSQKKDSRGRTIDMVTTSKIRNLLSMAADIYNQVMDCNDDELPEEISARIEYLRMRFVYEAGREPSVKNFVTEAGLLNIMKKVSGSKKKYILFYNYMEALVAFKRFKNSAMIKNDD